MYKQTQVNTVLISLLLILSGVIVATSDSIASALIALTINFVIGVLFYSMTVEVNANKVSWYFGLGFLRKEVDVVNITDMSSYDTKWYQGIGVRMLKDGWLYNVSVGQALKLTLAGGKTVYLGCKDIGVLKRALESAS
ncbi:hypothetical protein [Vibrio neptunius]|uniref:hypothetical protein n=1 Tax=Vibrio neptunius TaxID=170651 RepID=UPI0019D03BE5|nr:hypothetical protein [Vibrio neptunius]MBN3575625.1 hypothetical protein [Vibrio neptunius]